MELIKIESKEQMVDYLKKLKPKSYHVKYKSFVPIECSITINNSGQWDTIWEKDRVQIYERCDPMGTRLDFSPYAIEFILFNVAGVRYEYSTAEDTWVMTQKL